MKIKIWSERLARDGVNGRKWVWHYKITLKNRTVRGAGLTFTQCTAGIQRFLLRDEEAAAFVREARRKADRRRRHKIAEAVAAKEAEVRRAKRRSYLIWGPGRGLTA